MIDLNTDAVAEMARRMKLDRVTEFGDDPDGEKSDLRGHVTVVRNGEPVMLVYVGNGTEAARQCIYWCAALLRADELVLVTDARMRTYDAPKNVSDEDRERWLHEADYGHRPGEFQEDWNEGRRDGITECLIVQRMPAMGPARMNVYPYVRNGRKLTWQTDPIKDGGEIAGAIPDYARDGYNAARETTAKILAEIDKLWAEAGNAPLPPPEYQFHLDRALARMASEREGVAAVSVIADRSLFVNGEEE
jgi:hypothetical protein